MPEIEINGEKKKVAWGHRSSKCTHKDRVLIEVRKPGRPLSACPHPAGSCSCERVVLNYTIPKTSECRCSETQRTSNGPGPSRVQKGKGRRVGSTVTPSTVEKALNGSPTRPSRSSTTTSIDEVTPQPAKKSCCGGDEEVHNAESKSSLGPVSTNSVAGLQEGGQGQISNQLSRPAPEDDTAAGENGSRRAEWNDTYTNGDEAAYGGSELSRHATGSASDNILSITQSDSPAVSSGFPPPDTLSLHTGQLPPHANPFHRVEAKSMGVNGHHLGHLDTAFRATSQGMQVVDPSTSSFVHTCLCGDGCACLACLSHPHNKTTLDYVRYHTDLSMKGTNGAQVHATSVLGHISNLFNGGPQPTSNINHAHFQYDGTHQEPWIIDSTKAPQQTAQSQWQVPGLSQATPTQELGHLQLQSQEQDRRNHLVGHTAPPTQAPDVSNTTASPKFDGEHSETGVGFEHSSPQNSEEMPILSPSSFFLQSYIIPGCDDATGTCQCGDGCTCPGCLTHSGHQETPAPDEHTTDPFASHGKGCACPRPERTEPATPARHPAYNNPPQTFLQHQHHPTTTATSTATSPPHTNGTTTTTTTTTAPSPSSLRTPLTHIHGPSCACPDPAVMQAQAQVAAHAQLHGAGCRCPTGLVFLKAQLDAESRVFSSRVGGHEEQHPAGWMAGAPG